MEQNEHPCSECKRPDGCRNGKECAKWRIWFTKEWRKIRIDLGVEKER